MAKIKFPARGDFHKVLKQRVENYFEEHGLKSTGNWRMYLKSGIIISLFVTSYVYLVFFSTTLIEALISGFLLAQSFVLVGFNIMHDANHSSYSKNPFVNKLMGFSLDVMGGSNMIWRQKHNILHHTYTNIDELDDDIHSSGLLRLSPEQPWRPWHRFQHYYAFPLYSFLTISWMNFNDFQKFFTGYIGEYKLRRPSATDTTFFFLGKAFYYSYMLVLPMFFHSILTVLLTYVAVNLVIGFTISIVFQLAHTLEGNEFPTPDESTGAIENEWAIHQVETTVNFAPKNPIVTWYLGGLNYQIEHHLFAKICHVHYPAISKIVEKTCKEFSVYYISYPSVLAAIRAHYRFLRTLGLKTATA